MRCQPALNIPLSETNWRDYFACVGSTLEEFSCVERTFFNSGQIELKCKLAAHSFNYSFIKVRIIVNQYNELIIIFKINYLLVTTIVNR